ncbi:hypothetical protein GGS26DRAFT_561328 [Hypomontagnella submonticulosa]|nr:hypothetical protein GGS26DRAFT_561328 [Hypomontagnella submonticulosa]
MTSGSKIHASTAGHLCERCQVLQFDDPELPVLSRSAQHGCSFCSMLRLSILKDASHLPEREIRVRLQLIFSPEGRSMSVLARVEIQLGEKRENGM